MTSVTDKKGEDPIIYLFPLERTSAFDEELPNGHANQPPAEPVRQKWYQWFSPIDTAEERRLVIKLDCLILIYICIAYWVKVMDGSTISAAYVSGMKEDLALNGNELNYIGTINLVGFLIPQIPLTVMMARWGSSHWIPAADLFAGIFTLAQYKVSNVSQVYAIQFFLGVSGSFYYPGVHWYLGSWYKSSELSRRGALFFIASQLGSMSASYIQSAAYVTLDGRYGIASWRWLSIICFAITVPVAVVGFFLLPGTPDKPRGRFLTEEEIVLAKRRMEDEGREPAKPLTVAVIKDVLLGWHFWVLVGLTWFFSQTGGASIDLWLKAEGYSVEDINNITGAIPPVTIVACVVNGILSDAYDAKVALITATGLLNLFAAICLAVWNIPVGLKFLSYFIFGTAYGIAAVIYSWANEICGGSSEERAIVLSSMNTIGNVFSAWVPLLVWKVTEAPRYPRGFIWTITLNVGMIIMAWVTRYFWRQEKSRRHVSS
ncbi:unnamed protein product [Clonostachys byssicola]|uniref:Major facilitator superfamily (MFS) profile domain-containing protein n=1 Tax=Clonostachys byssicola TaxID=160290 RepID=A0A9N9UNH5_9HYPO|nr:unnamed protein product [Clonostachys byssicola]